MLFHSGLTRRRVLQVDASRPAHLDISGFTQVCMVYFTSCLQRYLAVGDSFQDALLRARFPPKTMPSDQQKRQLLGCQPTKRIRHDAREIIHLSVWFTALRTYSALLISEIPCQDDLQ